MIELPAKQTIEIPPAFYRDAGPPPPPDDPHWREWPHGDGFEPTPWWAIYGVPAFLLVLGIFHFAVLLVLVKVTL